MDKKIIAALLVFSLCMGTPEAAGAGVSAETALEASVQPYEAESSSKEKNSPIQLSKKPSEYGDENYALASSYPDTGSYPTGDKEYHGEQTYTANCPAVIEARFYVNDTKKDYETGFEAFLEKKGKDGKWYRVKPVSDIVQVNTGRGHFYNASESPREFVTFDLALYPLLPAGKYRIVKPFTDKGSKDYYKYAAFYEFSMTDKGEKFNADISMPTKKFKSAPKEITYNVQTKNGTYAVSDYCDIEYYSKGKWRSVRKDPIRANSIGGSYSLRFSGEDKLDTSGFDLSKKGKYRIRVSVEKTDLESYRMFMGVYGTLYGYFEIA